MQILEKPQQSEVDEIYGGRKGAGRQGMQVLGEPQKSGVLEGFGQKGKKHTEMLGRAKVEHTNATLGLR